mmetsp:Transcript_57292/g.139687  ORF Transcript_57292/g.139687 Transcript_57292/m.139687 type:complete len:802 (+) Transcript_57292:258-2663(+)
MTCSNNRQLHQPVRSIKNQSGETVSRRRQRIRKTVLLVDKKRRQPSQASVLVLLLLFLVSTTESSQTTRMIMSLMIMHQHKLIPSSTTQKNVSAFNFRSNSRRMASSISSSYQNRAYHHRCSSGHHRRFLSITPIERSDVIHDTGDQFHHRPRIRPRNIIDYRYHKLFTTSSRHQQHDDINSRNKSNSPSPSLIAESIESSIEKSLTEFFWDLENQQSSSSSINNSNKQNAIAVHIVISVSGGCDSVALLHACMEWWNLQKEQELQDKIFYTTFRRIHVVHFHHRQRADTEADGDCQLVQDLASSYGIPCHVEDWNQQQALDEAKNQTFSQGTARKWRRSKLLEYTQQQLESDNLDEHNINSNNQQSDEGNNIRKVGLILTAHHLEDSKESILLKLLRGVHLLNLGGMDEVTNLSPVDPDSTTNNDASLTNPTILLLRPFLNHSKQELKQYLSDRRLEWREDSSNSSNKYLRNRVRNELVPLLQDMTDGAFLSKRLPSMVRQSNLLANDVKPRVNEYLDQHLIRLKHDKQQQDRENSDLRSYFVLSDDSTATTTKGDDDGLSTSSLIFSQALFQWISNEMKQRGFLLNYETLERLIHQIDAYPDRLQWTLELGHGWTIIREGNILRLDDIGQPNATSYGLPRDNEGGKTWKWSMAAPDGASDSSIDSEEETLPMLISPDKLSSDLSFFSTTVGRIKGLVLGSSHAESTSPRFTPSWRNSPIKLRQFLRAQDVPLHRRDDVPILIMESNDYREIVAVKANEKWFVQKDYCHDPSSESCNNSYATSKANIVVRPMYRHQNHKS